MKKNNKQKKVIIGGTFDVLHKGHYFLLKKAFSLGHVTIGITSDEMAKKMKKRKVKAFKERKQEIKNYIEKNIKKDFSLIKIEDRFGPTLTKTFDYIVVSPETYKTALMINKKRSKLNKKLIEIVEIDFVLAEDGKPISSTRILKNIIDSNGKMV